jgi:hypothetical protein
MIMSYLPIPSTIYHSVHMSTVQLLSYIPGGELKFEALLKQ